MSRLYTCDGKLHTLCLSITEWRANKGFVTNWKNVPEKILLTVSELSEAFEAYRDLTERTLNFLNAEAYDGIAAEQTAKVDNFKEELADTFIRLADIAASLSINLEDAVEAKMLKNEERPFMHGMNCMLAENHATVIAAAAENAAENAPALQFDVTPTDPQSPLHTRLNPLHTRLKFPTEADLASRSDPINHPRHYTMGGIEVLDFILAWQLDFLAGNVIKYTVRAPYKGTQLEDLRKAQFYLNKMIERVEKEAEKEADHGEKGETK